MRTDRLPHYAIFYVPTSKYRASAMLVITDCKKIVYGGDLQMA